MMNWYIQIGLLILMNLLAFIWINKVDYKKTLRRRRRWKRYFWIIFLMLLPVDFIGYLLEILYIDYLGFLTGLVGIWFAISQINFANEHAGVSNLVIPLSTLFLISSGLLTVFAGFGIL